MAGVVLTIRFRTIVTMTLVAAGVVLAALALNATRNVLVNFVGGPSLGVTPEIG